jgi:hypothetical protein
VPHVLARVQALASHAAAVGRLDDAGAVDVPGCTGHATSGSHRAIGRAAAAPCPACRHAELTTVGASGSVVDPARAAGRTGALALDSPAAADGPPRATLALTYAAAVPSSCRTWVFSL